MYTILLSTVILFLVYCFVCSSQIVVHWSATEIKNGAANFACVSFLCMGLIYWEFFAEQRDISFVV